MVNDEILKLIEKLGELSAAQLAEEIGVSRQFIHRQLKSLIEDGSLEKIGRPPKTYYRKSGQLSMVHDDLILPPEKVAFLQHHFLFINENGNRYEGLEAMSLWCQRFQLPIEKTIDEFIKTRKRYLAYKDNAGFISGIQKIRDTKGFKEIGLDELYYQDFYAIERFGKTRLGNLLHFAKQGQNRKLMVEISTIVRPHLLQLIKEAKIDAVGYIPPTLKREVQIMNVFEKQFALPLPHIKLIKLKGDIVVPQKALSRLEDRIMNARNSIVIGDRLPFQKVLLIDDAVGSGATMNETALKLKSVGVALEVVGYAVTGSYKGFEVIQEI